MRKTLTYNDKVDIIVHLMVNGYLTKNQIKTILKRGVI